MYEGIESILLSRQPELYRLIKQKSLDEMNLPVKVYSKFIGFGKILDFYMFWITEKRGTLYFNAGKSFARAQGENRVRFIFEPSNQAAILEAMDRIYESYVSFSGSEAFDRELQRVEKQRAIRLAGTARAQALPTVALFWNQARDAVLARVEQPAVDHREIDSETVAGMESYGPQLVELFEKILCVMVDSHIRPSYGLSAYRDYIETDRVTLADLTSKYDRSREGIRLAIKSADKHLFATFQKAMVLDHAELNACVYQIATILEVFEYDMISMVGYGFSGIGERKQRAICNLLFGMLPADRIMAESRPLTEHVREQSKLLQKKLETLGDWEFYRAKICYPSSEKKSVNVQVESYESAQSYSHEKRVYSKLKRFEPTVEIIQNPDIVFYSSNRTDHRPHFLLNQTDKASVLVLVLPTLNMAFIYNIDRCNALHQFCKENGYGYLIIDDRGNSIYDLQHRVLDPALVDSLESILENQTLIVWENVRKLKEMHTVSNEDIAAYVLQKKLHFTMRPFCIRRRAET